MGSESRKLRTKTLHDFWPSTIFQTVVSVLALTTGNPVYLILTKAHTGCDRSAEDAYSPMAPDATFAFVGGQCCLTIDFVFAIWIMITFYTLLNSLFCIQTWQIISDFLNQSHDKTWSINSLYNGIFQWKLDRSTSNSSISKDALRQLRISAVYQLVFILSSCIYYTVLYSYLTVK
jgi:hypothetical protein